MIDIKINITNKIANAIGTPFIVCGNSDYTVTFTFDAEWGAYQEKTARFFFVSDGIEQYIDVLFSGNTCNAPVLPNIEKVLIGVYTGNLRTTTGAEVRCKRSILFGGKVHEPPTTEDVYNEILEIVSKKLGSEGGTVTGDYYKDGNTFIHEGNLDLLDNHFDNRSTVTATATGSAITIDSSQAPLQNLKLFGKTEQNGTPTPDNPIELKSVGDSGSFETGVYGKNLADYSKFTYQNYATDPTITIKGNVVELFANANGFYIDDLVMQKGKTYVISGSCLNVTNIRIYPKDDFNNLTEAINVPYNSTTGDFYYSYTATRSDMVVRFWVNNVTVALTNFMIRLADTTDSYELPCDKQSLTMPYTLRGVGDIKDEVDFNRGVLIQKFKELTLNGSEAWNGATNNRMYITLSDIAIPKDGNQIINAISNSFKPISYDAMTIYQTNGFSVNPLQALVFRYNDVTTNLDTWKTYLQTNPITVVYEMQTPQETPLTESELNAYRQLYTNKGNTTILNSDGADMEISYYINKPNAQAIGDIHTQINKDYFKLQQAIISTGGNV